MTAVLCLDEVLQRLDKATLVHLAQRREEPARRHYQPCPDCNDTGLRQVHRALDREIRFVSSVQTACGCGALRLYSGPKLPVVGMSSSLTTGGEGRLVCSGSVDQPTTQPGAQR